MKFIYLLYKGFEINLKVIGIQQKMTIKTDKLQRDHSEDAGEENREG